MFARVSALIATSAILAGCNAGSVGLPRQNFAVSSTAAAGGPQGRARSPVKHIVLIVQENRSFNDFFATFPKADGTTTGKAKADTQCHIGSNQTIKLKESGLLTKLNGKPQDLTHSYQGYVVARNGGAMNGWDTVPFGSGQPECTYPYQYTNPDDIKPYWEMAKQYALAEHMFTTQGSSSFTAHQDLIAGGTVVSPNEALVDLPSCSGPKCIWGCDAPSGTHTSLITYKNDFEPGKGPFPCLKYRTIRDLLDAKHVTWRYYVPEMCCAVYGRLLSAFDAIKAVRYSSEWTDGHISTPQTNIFNDIKNQQLQAVSWVIPDENDSDHPGTSSDTGPSWVASVVNALGKSDYWDSMAIIIVWDDWGGLYDNLDPRQVGYGGLGVRVPAIIVSPYAKPGYISTTQYEFGSILKYIETNWDLGSLGTSDKRAANLTDAFDYSQTPITFKRIRTKYPASYFLQRKPSYLPPDTDF